MPKSLHQYFKDFIAESKYSSRLSAETVKGYEAVFKLFSSIMPEINDVRLLTDEVTIEFFRRLQSRERLTGRDTWISGLKDSTIKTYSSKLDTFFEWLLRKAAIPVNPMKALKVPTPVFEDRRELSEGDIKTLYAAVALQAHSTFGLRRDTAILSLLVFTGVRKGELLSLLVQDIDFEKQLLSVRANTSKSRKLRCIPVHPTLRMHLLDYLAERNKRTYKTPYLLASLNRDKRLSPHGLKHWVSTLSKRAGIRFHLHQLRHTFACNLARKNVNAVKIQKLLGHSSLNMTMTYLRSVATEDMHDDINRLWF